MEIIRYVVGSLDTNCYFIYSDGEMAVIDPGAKSDNLIKKISERTEKFKYIICTHGHHDHIDGLGSLLDKFKPKLLCHEAEKKIIDIPADRYLTEGDSINIGSIKLTVIHTPGHTPGGICLLGKGLSLESPGGGKVFRNNTDTAGVLFTGDTLFLNGYGRTDLEWGDEAEMEKSLHRLKTIIKPGMFILPGHGDTAIYS